MSLSKAEGLVLVQGVQAHGLAVLRHLHGPAGVAVAMDQDHAKNGCGGDDGDEDIQKPRGFVFFGSIAVTSKGYGCEDKSNCILLHFGGNGKRLGAFVNTPQNPPGKAA